MNDRHQCILLGALVIVVGLVIYELWSILVFGCVGAALMVAAIADSENDI
jgi:hypothetical protein